MSGRAAVPAGAPRTVDAPRRGRATTRVLAGVDEAGLGPLLGPLAIGYSVLRAPATEPDPWRLLRRTVHKRPTKHAKLVVADSKRVFARNAVGRRRLEKTVLTFLALLRADGRPPRDPAELLFGALEPERGLVARHPWYARLPDLPRELAADTIELGAAGLARRMQARGLALLDAGVRVVPSGELNASYRDTDNKALTVWRRCLEVLRHLWERHGEESPEVTVDLLGGRGHYARLLERGFPEASVRVLFEQHGHAAYVLDERGDAATERWLPRRMRLDFRAKGEDASFAVALASCIAKYSRELVMSAFNDFFAELQPGLRPTAGYRTDGTRWLADAERAIRAAGLGPDVLIRSR